MIDTESVNNSPVKSRRPANDAVSDAKKDAIKKPKGREGDRPRSKFPVLKPQRPPKPDRAVNPKPPIIDSSLAEAHHEPDSEPSREPEIEIEPLSTLPSPFVLSPSANVTPHPPPNTPPPDLCAARTSRRQRGSVSYAEPNLRDKMRRPTKDLVDAVGGDDKNQFYRSASARAESEAPDDADALTVINQRKIEKPRNIKNTVVKAERSEEENWKDLPLAVTTKHGEINVGGEVPESNEMAIKEPWVDDVPRIDPENADFEVKVSRKASGSSAAIAALAGPSRAKSNRGIAVVLEPKNPNPTTQPVSNLPETETLVLPNASKLKDPGDNASTASAAPCVIPLTMASRTSRRYSSVPEALGETGSRRLTQPSSQDVLTRTGSVRRKDPGSTTKKNIVNDVGEIELRGGVVEGLGGKNGAKGDRERERAERVASRRKSMMI